MKKFLALFGILCLLFALSTATVYAAKPADNDNDGYNTKSDCNDNDPLINPGVSEVCGDGVDNNCDGSIDEGCSGPIDNDNDGYDNTVDCNDNDPNVNPGAQEICGDGIDNDCVGGDESCGTDPNHGSLTWSDYPTACLTCHDTQFNEMADSTHYKWVGDTPEMVNAPGTLQGKLTSSVNSYCINILGDWKICGKCHVGRGLRPDDQAAGLENIDCLMCHNEDYALARTRLPDGSMGPATGLDSYVQNIAKPTTTNCLKCHAFAGGGNAVKRGDLSMSGTDLHGDPLAEGTNNNTNADFDVHMNTTASDVQCQDCHVFTNHKTIGRGSDLRPTDDVARGSEINCATCHTGFDQAGGHAAAGANRTDADRHINHVSCQACHVDKYAKVATETNRDWRLYPDGSPADGSQGKSHPNLTVEGDLTPTYKFWNRLSDNYLLGDDASLTYDADKGTYPTSRPMGNLNDGKLYPFKYKTADQPMIVDGNKLLALDTLEYLGISTNYQAAVESGLANMGYPTSEPVVSVVTDTYQLINHGIPTAGTVNCDKCHGDWGLSTDSFLDQEGYKLKAAKADICAQCHREKNLKNNHTGMHNHVNKGAGMDCLFCHSFTRQSEKGGIGPCDANASDFVDNVPFNHPECN